MKELANVGSAAGQSAVLSCVFTVAALSPTHADPTPAVTAALDRFQSACATALSDPDAYIASLTLPGPSGEEGLYPSDDGHYLLVLTAQSEGVTDHVEITALADQMIRRCAISAILPGFPEEPRIAAALRPLLDARASQVVGGKTRSANPIWEPENEPVLFEGEDFHMFFATGLFPDPDTVAQIQTMSGEVYMTVERTLTAAELAQ